MESRGRGWLLSLAAIAGSVLTGPAWGLSLTVSPATVEMTVAAGSSHQASIDIHNGGETPIELRAYLFDWWHEDDAYQFPPPGTVERTAALWSSVLPRKVRIDPQARAKLSLTVEPPEDAAAGYFAVLFLDASPVSAPSAEPTAKMGVGGRIGVLVAVRIEDSGQDAMVIEDVTVTAPTASTPLAVKSRVRNTGDVHVSPESRVLIMDAEGEARARLEGRGRIILPGQGEVIESVWGGELEDGVYTALVTVVYGEGQAATTQHTFAVGSP